MKKLISLLFIILMSSTLIVNAAAITVEDVVDISNSIITVNGTSDKPLETVTVQVFKGDKKLSEINTAIVAREAVVYVGQSVTDEDGKFTFLFKYTGDTDTETLNGYLVFDSTTQPEDFAVKFTKFSYYETLIGNHNTTANADNSTDFINYCSNNKDSLCPDLQLVGDINFSKAAEYFLAEVKAKALNPADSFTNQERFMSCIAAQAFNEGKLNSVNKIADVIDLEDSLREDIKVVTDSANADKHFASLMTGQNITSVSKLNDEFKEAMILTAVKYTNGFSNLKELCEEYADFIGISTYSSGAYQAIAGTDISSLTELKEKLDAADSTPVSSSPGKGKNDRGGNQFSVSGNVSTEVIGEVHMPFEDLSPANWAYEAVSLLSDKKIINGKSDNLFYPNDCVTREEFAKMIVGAIGLTVSNDNTGKFNDVEGSAWYMPYVYTAYNNGICKGISEDEFGVGRNIIRQDAAVMIYNAAGDIAAISDTVDFADSNDISDYAKTAVSALASSGVINGKGNGAFEPMSFLTRAEAAQIIYKAFFGV